MGVWEWECWNGNVGMPKTFLGSNTFLGSKTFLWLKTFWGLKTFLGSLIA